MQTLKINITDISTIYEINIQVKHKTHTKVNFFSIYAAQATKYCPILMMTANIKHISCNPILRTLL